MNSEPQRLWPHSPIHNTLLPGLYIVTAATFNKAPLFCDSARLDLLCETLFNLAKEHDCHLQAWAVFPNHYHYVARCNSTNSIERLSRHLHAKTAVALNKCDDVTGRKVWFQYWDSQITFERSYFARLNYVHQNPSRHGLVAISNRYKWCSAGWFETKASRSFCKTVSGFKYDRLDIPDNFQVHMDESILGGGS